MRPRACPARGVVPTQEEDMKNFLEAMLNDINSDGCGCRDDVAPPLTEAMI
jgi:hypothetical protein